MVLRECGAFNIQFENHVLNALRHLANVEHTTLVEERVV